MKVIKFAAQQEIGGCHPAHLFANALNRAIDGNQSKSGANYSDDTAIILFRDKPLLVEFVVIHGQKEWKDGLSEDDYYISYSNAPLTLSMAGKFVARCDKDGDYSIGCENDTYSHPQDHGFWRVYFDYDIPKHVTELDFSVLAF